MHRHWSLNAISGCARHLRFCLPAQTLRTELSVRTVNSISAPFSACFWKGATIRLTASMWLLLGVADSRACSSAAEPTVEVPSPPPMLTRWAAKVDRAAPLAEYPRPQMQRQDWINLNGEWDYAICPRGAIRPPSHFEGSILVPFAVESHLSGVGRRVGKGERLWYRRTFSVPALTGGRRLLLHFGAVDWQADVFLNGQALGRHEGGYDEFTFDVTDRLIRGEQQELVVAVWDPTDGAEQPRGKQAVRPGGIWYTPVTGIWQTVWLEIVPAASLYGVTIAPDLNQGAANFVFTLHRARRGEARIRVLANGATVAQTEFIPIAAALGGKTQPITVAVPDARRWSPDDPFLYDVQITYRSGDNVDEVSSYFGFRNVEVRRTADGHPRIFLNGEPLFLFGPLDQGWWPDGLYTAPTDEALRWDIETMRRMGFNLVRKHVKVEPARWYYHCDKIGLLVWQDMPSGMIGGVPADRPEEESLDGLTTPEGAAQFRRELGAMVENLRHFPSIIAWVPFNEGWGQHDCNETLAWIKRLDPTRLVDGPSGWNDLGFGDLFDQHYYEGTRLWPLQPGRANVLGEFGALKHAVTGHVWGRDSTRSTPSESAADFAQRYATLLNPLNSFRSAGLAGAVYTQLTDVEGEINGLITYDREVIKIPLEELATEHRALIETGVKREEHR
jgi:hypothetical protein